jgi:competence protein CoiA
MKFALVEGQRQEAQPHLSGKCPACDQPMIAKCGEKRVRHWAHKSTFFCDHWWESETEWHRNWKDQFPASWQEFIYRAANGERHIADVRTDHEWVIELQHSYIKPEERRSRDAFYKKLVWVVDATRRETDATQFSEAWKVAIPVNGNSVVRRIRLDECRLLREWSDSYGSIFFDFGNELHLVWLLPRRPDEPAFAAVFPRNFFIEVHHGKGPDWARDFDQLTRTFGDLVAHYNAHLRSQTLRQTALPTGFQQYLAHRRVRRRL